MFAQVVAMLMERGLILKKGTIVDSTMSSAPSATKNKEKKRDPDACQTKKGNRWHFGYKAHRLLVFCTEKILETVTADMLALRSPRIQS